MSNSDPSTLPTLAILAGGLATRLKPVSDRLPKSLVPVHGLPFVYWQLADLEERGFRDIVMLLGHRAKDVMDAVGDGSRFGVQVRYEVEPSTPPCGTGGAIVRALPGLPPVFATLYGDSLLPFDFRRPCAAFRSDNALALMTIRRAASEEQPNAAAAGSRVARYDKTSADRSGLGFIDYGFSVWRKEAFDPFRSESVPFDLGKVQSFCALQGSLAAFEVTEPYYEIGSFVGIERLEKALTGGVVPSPKHIVAMRR